MYFIVKNVNSNALCLVKLTKKLCKKWKVKFTNNRLTKFIFIVQKKNLTLNSKIVVTNF